MFGILKAGSQLYIYHKSASVPYVEMGIVENPVNTNTMMGFYPNMPMLPIDITLKVGIKTVSYQRLPPNAEVADVTESTTGETVTIACTREALNHELQADRQNSIDAINSVDYHKNRVTAIDELIQRVNPEQAEKAAQQAEIKTLKEQVVVMSQNVKDLMAQNKELMEQLKGDRTKSTKKGD